MMYAAWKGEMGGGDAVAAYRRFVESGIESPPANPLAAAQEGWLLGGDEFIARIKRMLERPCNPDEVPQWKRLRLSAAEVVQVVAQFYGVRAESYSARRSQAPGRDLAAYLVHRRTTATLREVAALFGLGHPDSSSNLIRKAEKSLAQSTTLRADLEEIERLMLNAG